MTNKVKPNQDDAAREAPHENPTEIVLAEIHEISLVDKPSNRFVVFLWWPIIYCILNLNVKRR